MASTPKDDETLSLLWAAHFAELKNMSDEDVLAGTDVPRLQTDRAVLLASVKAEAGRRRLTAAKAQLDAAKVRPGQVQQAVSIAEARAFLQKAANDSRFTMAARALDEMTDEMVLRTYARVKQMLDENPAPGAS